MPFRNSPIESTPIHDDIHADESLRPSHFDGFSGQTAIVENLKVMLQSAKMRESALDHTLFSGPPGLGKTTLGHIIARELGVNLHLSSGPALEKSGDLAGILSTLQPHDVLFIDEIHRLNPVVEENLYPAMEDFYFEIVIGDGPHARSMKLSLPPFTLVGATTRSGLMTAPLRDRFGYVARLNYYSDDELATIVSRSSDILTMNIHPDAASEIARRSRGTPRIANRLLRRVRDYATVHRASVVDLDLARFALNKIDVDSIGLDYLDRLYLDALVCKFSGGPTGLETLAASIGEEKNTIEEVIEPFLLQRAFIQKTPRGRLATVRAFEHLGVLPRKDSPFV